MYIIISIIVSLIYTLHIAAAAEYPILITLAPEIHAIFSRSTNHSLADLLQDPLACTQARYYMRNLREKPYFRIPTARDLTTRRAQWLQLDRLTHIYFTDIRDRLESTADEPDVKTNPFLKGLLIANVIFQQEWLSADPEVFNSVHQPKVAAAASSSRPKKGTARVPRASSKRHIHRKKS